MLEICRLRSRLGQRAAPASTRSKLAVAERNKNGKRRITKKARKGWRSSFWQHLRGWRIFTFQCVPKQECRVGGVNPRGLKYQVNLLSLLVSKSCRYTHWASKYAIFRQKNSKSKFSQTPVPLTPQTKKGAYLYECTSHRKFWLRL